MADINVTLVISDGITVAAQVAANPIDVDVAVGTGGGSSTDEKVKYDVGDVAAGYVADKIVAGTGISIAEGAGLLENKSVVTNSDLGSSAISAHNIAFTHSNIHALHADDQDLSGLVVKETGKSLVSDTEISKIHANTLDHTQGTDQGLDTGGTNAVTAAQAKAGYTHSGVAHAPSDAEKNVNADWNSVTGDSEILNKPTILALGDLITNAYYGDKGKTAYDHSQVAHAPSGAQANNISDINATDLTDGGTTNLHSHANDHASGSDNETATSIINLGIDEIEFAVIKSYMI